MEEARPEQLFEGIPPDASTALQAYIEADTPSFYIRKTYPDYYNYFTPVNHIDRVAATGVMVGLCAIGVSAVDGFATSQGNASLNIEDYRDAAAEQMNAFIASVEDDISRSPNEIIVPRHDLDSNGRARNTTEEVYDVTTQAGLERFIEDQISSSTLEQGQKEALIPAVETEGEQRSTETDQELVGALYDVSETHASSYPDREPITTNANTGELFVGGSLLILASLVGHTILSGRQDKQFERYLQAKEAIDEIYVRNGILDSLLNKVNYRSRFYKKDDQPQGGGRKRRKAIISSMRDALLENEAEKMTV